ncbi:hypothetical protein MHLP_00890 [Candidatus Mycoplasma haematolamae str. Purdue]|uniref:Uncharacterized protein n=1 Tax=Mycoplasma haematolamae (strain Purdue) TaxID=1212765 RepID=I7BIV5_MYCHA|nr:hypothetical protein [Candidatus Mycoplasma haematolamae]AFO51758.1 hypothetical protein MHLP_00890 [Candidatus Mycoplasma haematolamae str. Purdue]
MIGKALAAKIGVPFLSLGGLCGGGYLVISPYLISTSDPVNKENKVEGWEAAFKVSGSETQSKLVCLDSSLEKGKNQKHGLRLLQISEKSAEVSCVVSESDQSSQLKVVKVKEEKAYEEIEEKDGKISGLSCNSYDSFPYKLFQCSCSSETLKMSSENNQKIIFTIEESTN